MNRFRFGLASIALSLGLLACLNQASAKSLTVTRATLPNGLKIVVVHDSLAPVVTTMLNYKAGSNDQSIAGLAHATEHMMFRGSQTLSSSQLMDSVDITGGNFNADTQSSITQYFFTVPAQYLDIALRLERSRATGALLSQTQWNDERKAITQEVTQDNSNAFYRLVTKMQATLLAGTPYAKNGLGTVYDFAHTINHPQILNFYKTWYHPNNAVYIIVGNVDGPATVARIRQLFGDIPAAKLPPREAVNLGPLKTHLYHDFSDQPFTAVLLGYRLPGFTSKDFAAANILSDILNSQRGDLFALTAQGKALGSEFVLQPYAKVSVGLALMVVPVTTKPEVADGLMRGVIENYRKWGVPADLVQASIRREIAQLEYNATSIEGLATEWSDAVAVQGLSSPDDMIAAYKRVTPADVNRLFRTALASSKSVAAYAVPKNLGKMSAGGGALAKENNSIPPSKHELLPVWARDVLAHLQVPAQTLHPVVTSLPNGLRIIVQPDHSTNTVTVTGDIDNDPQVQEPAGKEGVDSLTGDLFGYGSASRDRLVYQRELDSIAANESGGTSFSLQVLSGDFEHGVQLLADNELHPRFVPQYFDIVKSQEVGSLTGVENSPDHLAAVATAKALYPPGDPAQRFANTTTMSALTLDDVKQYYAAAYRPDLTTVVVVGDVTPARARQVLAKYFGAWTAHGPKPQTEPPPVPPNKASAADIPATGRVQSSVQLIQTSGIKRTSADWPALQVANTILTGGFYSSLLYHDLREVKGYVYYVSSGLSTEKTRSSFSVSYGSDPSKVVPAQQLVVADLTRMQSQPVAADRLLRAKAQLMGEIPITLASYDGVGSILHRYASLDLPLNQNLIDARRELSVTASRVAAAMRKWIRPDDFVRIVTGPGPK
ncbi:MAG TPA: pitrilysin family protein [Candidatus Rubrimentiphilum sp.]|nr:pitrilysin family protein [Candidatus Rubrimentiphilum sp.]